MTIRRRRRFVSRNRRLSRLPDAKERDEIACFGEYFKFCGETRPTARVRPADPVAGGNLYRSLSWSTGFGVDVKRTVRRYVGHLIDLGSRPSRGGRCWRLGRFGAFRLLDAAADAHRTREALAVLFRFRSPGRRAGL